jgi:hypothetical protein
MKTRNLAGFGAIPRRTDGGIPCTSDCVAESKTFEPEY